MSVLPQEGDVTLADAAARTDRRRQRMAWPIRRFELGAEPADDLRRTTSADERIAMVWALSQLAWRLSGRTFPDYERAETPGRIRRVGDSA